MTLPLVFLILCLNVTIISLILIDSSVLILNKMNLSVISSVLIRPLICSIRKRLLIVIILILLMRLREIFILMGQSLLLFWFMKIS